MSTFSKGDRVEWLGCWSEGRTGVLLTDAISDDPHTTVLVNWDNGGQETVKIGALRKVEPEWVIGQQVSGTDYERLPVGSVVTLGLGFAVWTKSPDGLWRDASGVVAAGGEVKRLVRTLTHLGDGTHSDTDSLTDSDTVTEPEGTDAAYVEPEPLKEGDAEVTASTAIAQMANAMHDFATGFEKAGQIFWREMQWVRGGAS